jgi:hypothetical protein
MRKKITNKINKWCMWMLPYASYNLQSSLKNFSITTVPV